ncbi:MAG: DedA family protein [Thermodesulfovibrio sp.]|nr:DedA family protein [Thermodesulfovibrio sp.]
MDSYSIIAKFSYPGVFVLLILGGLGIPLFPEDLVLIACGVLISVGIIKPVPTVIVAYTGLVISDSMLYWIGRKFGRRVVTNPRFFKIISPSKFLLLEKSFKKHSTLIMLLARLLVGFRAQAFILAGITKVSWIKFIIIDSLASAVVLAVMMTAGYMGGKFLENVKKGIVYMEYVVGFLIIVAVILLTIYFSYRYLKKMSSQ